MFKVLITAAMLVPLAGVGCESNAKKSPPASSDANVAAAKAVPSDPKARGMDPVYAYVDSVRADLSNGKAQLINDVMRLSPEEAAKFWPIYHDYEDELFALGDQRVEMTRSFAAAQAKQSLDNAKAAGLADDWFKFESQRLELLRKYHKRIADDLSPLRAAQFTQIEHRVGTVIDLVIASELPLVELPTSPAPR